MDLYRVLLVDDEEEVFQAIIKKINWEAIGFSVIGYARNGEEALEMIESNTPDVVMTDIKMPFMDGLTLCKKVKQIYGNIKVIIFSGFDEFEYAREAIKIEAEEYILKPINAQELQDVFERVKVSLDKELDEKRNIHKLQEYYLQSLPILQNQFLISLMEGQAEEEKIPTYLREYQLYLEANHYLVTMIHMDYYTTSEKKPYIDDVKLAMVSLKHLVEENMNGNWKSKCFLFLGDLFLLTLLDNENKLKEYINDVDRACKISERILGIRTTAGIGRTCSNLEDIHLSYKEAKNANAYRIMYEESQAIYIGEVEPLSNREFSLEDSDIQQIIREIKLGEKEDLNLSIEGFVKKVKSNQYSIQQFRIILMEFITELFKLGGIYGINMEEVFQGEKDVYQKVQQFDSLDVLEQWVQEVCLSIRNSIRKERLDSAKLLIDSAITYIEENYMDQELSIDTICNYLNVSSAYFSTIFKKETRKTFINYVTWLRMERAIQLLNTTDDKTYVIAEKVGYSEPNYFSYVFKKQYGTSPSKYRQNRVENHD